MFPIRQLQTPIIIFLLAILTFLCHGLSLNAEFMVDDLSYLMPSQLLLKYHHFANFFFLPNNHHYSPFDTILNFYSFQTFPSPIILYGFNLLLFYINALLFFFNVRNLTQNPFISFLSAILLVIHPLGADNLCHITSNSTFFSALFLQMSMLGFWHSVSSPKKQKRWFYLSLGSYLIGLLFLETALLFPGYLLSLCLLKPVRERGRILLLTLPFWALSIAYFFVWIAMTNDSHGLIAKINHLNLSIPSYIATLAVLLKWYFGNLFFPDNPVCIKNSLVLTNYLWPWIVGLFIAMSLLICFIWLWRSNPKGFALLWFLIGFIFMIPASLIHAYSMGMVIEPHWFFFSIMGFFLFLAQIFYDIKAKINALLYRGLLATIIFYWAISSYHHHIIALTEIHYLEYWLKHSPKNRLPALRLGELYGTHDSLKIPYQLISEMDYHVDFYIKTQQYRPAAALVEKMILSSPHHPNRELWDYLLIALYLQTGEHTKITAPLETFKSTILPEHNYLLMASQLIRVRLYEQAVLILDQGLSHTPKSSNMIFLKALSLANLNRFDEAESLLSTLTKENLNNSQFSETLKEIRSLKMTHNQAP